MAIRDRAGDSNSGMGGWSNQHWGWTCDTDALWVKKNLRDGEEVCDSFPRSELEKTNKTAIH